jgi:hypothetical protein
MKNSFAVNILNGPEQLIHVSLDLVMMQVFITHQTLVKILLHQLENKSQLAYIA